MKLHIWPIAFALLGACNSNDTQRAPPAPGAPEARRAPPLPRARAADAGVPATTETTSGTSTGENAKPTSSATGTTPAGNTGANASGTDNNSGSPNPTQH